MRTYKIDGFHPAMLGGLAVRLKTEKGFFYVFSITSDLSEIDYDYSSTDAKDLTKGCEVDIDYGEGMYEALKTHLIEVLKELQLDRQAAILFQKRYQ